MFFIFLAFVIVFRILCTLQAGRISVDSFLFMTEDKTNSLN